jgi:hypothetical protein
LYKNEISLLSSIFPINNLLAIEFASSQLDFDTRVGFKNKLSLKKAPKKSQRLNCKLRLGT